MYNRLGLVIFIVLSVAWQVHGAVNCTTAGRFPDQADTTCQNYTLCLYESSTATFVAYDYLCPTTTLFDPATGRCTADGNFVCNVTANTDNTAPDSVCTADGFIADPSSTNCTSYIECIQINGTFIETTYTCPENTFYNPNNTLCETDYNCTTIAPFSCSAAGRFPNDSDATCQTYYMCVLANNGTFAQYQYTCPSTSVFSPASRVCTTSYTCPNSG